MYKALTQSEGLHSVIPIGTLMEKLIWVSSPSTAEAYSAKFNDVVSATGTLFLDPSFIPWIQKNESKC